ncbi:D-2-hydroxyacid dehydrogenase [uncultured Limosilactobacillus sp.]|uniref:D-2-hydroxyacid dehydrogenase n=1 Tax=uncultured Limosilactobacillus sp. TaxID=2837629 RepID=UPI0025F00B5B|nr:D-2-hydroxyacid dehydrogenase [uncultured Limosilactobacillus sp.]
MKIIAYGIREDERPYVKNWQWANPDVELVWTDKLLDVESAELAKGCDGVVAYQQKNYSADLLKRLHEMNIHNLSLRNVGIDNVDTKAAVKYGFKITNVPVYSPAAIAEFGVTQLLNLLRRTKEFQNKFAKRDYRWAPNIGKELNQQTVGIVGAGHIGRVMAHICRGFGARVMVYNHRPKPDLVKAGVFTDSLDELYKESTVISLHVPAVKSTYHMLNRDSFAKMQKGVLIINMSRGSLIDEQDLIEALDSGQVGGAALDVLEDETKIFNKNMANQPSNYPAFDNLESRENVLITPHTAFYTDEAVRNMVEQSLDASRELTLTGASDKMVKLG